MAIIELHKIVKKYGNHKVLDNIDISIQEGSMTAIVGESGKGKSTIMNIIGLIENYDEGELIICGKSKIKPDTRQASKMIRENISYLFQNFALIDNETVEANLMLALNYVNISKAEKAKKISTALKEVKLQGYEKRKVFTLSGGEQQRVAIARLLINPKKIVLADEPTGSLDSENRNSVLQYLERLNKNGSTIVIVTHDNYVADFCSTKIVLK